MTQLKDSGSSPNTSNNNSSLTPTTTPIPTPIPTPMDPLKKKPASVVWNHLKMFEDGDHNDSQAKCNQCGKMYECHYKRYHTSQLKVQLEKQYMKRPIRFIYFLI